MSGVNTKQNSPIETLERRTLLSAGLLDSTFGTGGTLAIPAAANTYVGSDAVAVQSDGKLVLLQVSEPGQPGSQVFTTPRIQVRRILSSGALDPSFGSGGIASVPAVASDSFQGPNGLLVQPNGDILVSSGFTLARLTPAGALDKSFAAGKGFESSGEGSIALQRDGKIVMAGRRLNADGSLDKTYGTNGLVSVNLGANVSGAAFGGVAIDPSGRAVFSIAARTNSAQSPSEFLLVRLTTSGKQDTTFGKNGVASDGGQQDDLTGDNFGGEVAIAPNGTIYLAANYEQFQGDDITRIYAFSNSGVMTAGASGLSPGGTFGLAVQADNKLLATGYYFVPNTGNTNAFVERFLAAPTSPPLALKPLQADASFNGTGSRQLDFSSGGQNDREISGGFYGDYGWALALQSDGKIVVAGTTLESADATPPKSGKTITDEFTVTRLTGDLVASAAFTSTDLTITGTSGNDTINVSRSGNNILVSINGKSFGPFAVGGFPHNSPAIRVLGLDGNDSIVVHAGNIPLTVFGGAGNDSITGGEGPNTLFGGAGDDDLRPGAGPSNDIYGGDAANGVLDGNDAVDYSQRTHAMEIHLDGKRDSGMSGEHDLISTNIQRVFGSQGNDTIFGNFNGVKNAIYGLGGNDTIFAGNAPNALYGGDGNDFLYARDNIADYLDGGAGADSVHIDKLDQTVDVEVFLP